MIEKGFIYYPERLILGKPSDLGMEYEDVYFPTEDGLKLNGWFTRGERDITWLWFPGNAGNISYRLDNLGILHQKLGVNAFIFDYRGYGNSQGRVSEKGTYLDAQAALSYLRSRRDINPAHIVLFGRSLGSAIAVDLASKQKCLGLILESPFTNVKDMVRRVIPFLPGGIIRTKYDSISKIKRVTVPLLILHGNHDEVVPLELGKRLYEAANEPKEFYIIDGAGHNDTYLVGGEEYFAKLDEFITGLTK